MVQTYLPFRQVRSIFWMVSKCYFLQFLDILPPGNQSIFVFFIQSSSFGSQGLCLPQRSKKSSVMSVVRPRNFVLQVYYINGKSLEGHEQYYLTMQLNQNICLLQRQEREKTVTVFSDRYKNRVKASSIYLFIALENYAFASYNCSGEI